MRKYLIAVGTAIAALGLVAQVSTADAHLLGRRSPSVTVSQLIVGGAMTGTFIAKTYRHGRFEKIGTARFWKWYGLTTVGCFALTPMMSAALVAHNEKRELKSSEVFIMLGDCVVPILGGLFWQAMFDANPHWDNGTGRPTR